MSVFCLYLLAVSMVTSLFGCGSSSSTDEYWITDIKVPAPMKVTMTNKQGKVLTFTGPPSEVWPLIKPLKSKDGKLWVTDLGPFLILKARHATPPVKIVYKVKKVPVYIVKKVPVYKVKKVPVYIVKKIYVKSPVQKTTKTHHYTKRYRHPEKNQKGNTCADPSTKCPS